MKIVVNHLTRMRPGYICVAGVDMATGKHIRPVLGASLGTALLARHGGPFAIAAVVDLGYTYYAGRAPETEDHRFERRQVRTVRDMSAEEFWRVLEKTARPNLTAIFGPALRPHGHGAVVASGSGQWSLGCLASASPPELVLTGDYKIRLLLPTRTVMLDLSVTDLRLYDYTAGQYVPKQEVVADVARRIAAGVRVILSVGLGRPWQKLDGSPPQHWLQVNSLHLEDDPAWRLGA